MPVIWQLEKAQQMGKTNCDLPVPIHLLKCANQINERIRLLRRIQIFTRFPKQLYEQEFLPTEISETKFLNQEKMLVKRITSVFKNLVGRINMDIKIKTYIYFF